MFHSSTKERIAELYERVKMGDDRLAQLEVDEKMMETLIRVGDEAVRRLPNIGKERAMIESNNAQLLEAIADLREG